MRLTHSMAALFLFVGSTVLGLYFLGSAGLAFIAGTSYSALAPLACNFVLRNGR